MSATGVGATVGAVIALTWIALGFWACVLVSVTMAVGALVARVVTGQLDVRAVAAALRGRRTSS
ncbi:hypothetical protein [Microbacterium halotolerans]|uniref:hypothetical protein n=1 Tax=Microbacterium halotolerans TaxID=246613 RepID=UPI000E6AC845|nr:hypothetical protein [Microbacterium halotolerans]